MKPVRKVPDHAFLIGFAFYQIWIYAAFFTQDAYVSASDPDLVRYRIYLESLAVLCASLVIIAFRPSLMKGDRRIASGRLGAALLVACAPLMALADDSGGLPLAALHAAGLLSGAGTALLGAIWAVSFRKAGSKSLSSVPAIILAEGLLVLGQQASPAFAISALVAFPIVSSICALTPLRRANGGGQGGASAARPSLAQFAGYGFAWLAFGAALGVFIGASGTESLRRLQDGTWLAVLALTSLAVMVMMRTIVPPSPHDGEGDPECDDARRRGRTSALVFGIVLSTLLLVPLLFRGGSEQTSIASVPSIASFALIELMTLMLFASAADKFNLFVPTVYGMGRAGRALGVFVGSLASQAFLAQGGNAAFDQVKTILLVMACEIVVVLAFLFAMRKSRRADDRKTPFPDSVESACEDIAEAHGLSARESEVLALLAKGWTQKRIQDELLIARSTASTHIHHVYQKLGVRSKQEVIDLVETQRLADAETGTKQAPPARSQPTSPRRGNP